MEKLISIKHKKIWENMMPAVVNTASGSFLCADKSGKNNFVLYVTNPDIYLYSSENDDWIKINGSGLSGLSNGMCGTFHQWSGIFTALDGSTNFVKISSTLYTIKGNVVGKTIEFLTGNSVNNGNRSLTITRILKNDDDQSITLFFSGLLQSVCKNGDTFRIKSGSFFVLGTGTLGSNSFKRFDLATMKWYSLNHIGLPSSWNALGAMVSTDTDNIYYDSGIVSEGTNTTMYVTGRNWAVDQWKNYQVRITKGKHTGLIRVITGNSKDTLTFDSADIVDCTSEFVIEGNEDSIYILGNNSSASVYKYSIKNNVSQIITPTVMRGNYPSSGMNAVFISKTDDEGWADIRSIKDGRYIFSLRGGNTNKIDRFDITQLSWTEITFDSPILFNEGSSGFVDSKFIFLVKEGSATIPQRFYIYNVVEDKLEPFTSDYFLGGLAVAGNKIFIKKLEGSTEKWLYSLQCSSSILRRIMIF